MLWKYTDSVAFFGIISFKIFSLMDTVSQGMKKKIQGQLLPYIRIP